MIPTKEVFAKLGTGVAIRRMHYLLTDKLQSEKTVGSLNMIFTEVFLPPLKLSNHYRYSTSLIITIEPATTQPNNHCPISFLLCSYKSKLV